MNQSDLRDRFTVCVKLRLTTKVKCYISVIQLSFPSSSINIKGVVHFKKKIIL